MEVAFAKEPLQYHFSFTFYYFLFLGYQNQQQTKPNKIYQLLLTGTSIISLLKMQKIKSQIFTQITNKQVRKYIEDNIFSLEAINKQKNAFIGNFNTNHQLNSSSMFSSYLEQKNCKNDLSIKTLLQRIQTHIVTNGFYKNIEEMKELNNKTKQLKLANEQFERKLYQNQPISQSRKQQTRTLQDRDKSSLHISTSASDFKSEFSYDEQIKDAYKKLNFTKMKRKMISIVKMSQQQKYKVLQKTKRQYDSIRKHIQTLQRVIRNVQKIHPEQAWVQLQLEETQKQYDEKRMLLGNDGRLNAEIQIIEKKLQSFPKQSASLLVNKQTYYQQTHSQSQIPYQSYAHQNGQKQISQLQQRLQSLENFIRQEQNEKLSLIGQIKNFTQRFDKEKKKNQTMLDKIKQNFFNSPQLIDGVVKLNEQKPEEVRFLMDKLGVKF